MTTSSLTPPKPEATPEPAVGSPEHTAAMVAKFDEQSPAPTTPVTPETPETSETPERPAWLPEKFATPEDMAKAYGELETKLSAPKADTPAATETPATPEAQAQEAVANAGLDFASLTTEFGETGAVSEASYEALAKSGIPREVVDGYVAGQMAIAAQLTSSIYSSAGGEEAYTAMLSWAGDNLAAADVDAFNAAIDSGNVNSMKLAVAGLKAQYAAANGTEPTLLGGGEGTQSNTVFADTAQMTAAMRDPRYKTSEAYRAEVAAKVARSKF